MQFHENGYVIGDPLDKPAAESVASRSAELPDELDVLIVGTGPAGMLLAAQLSAFPEINTRIIEKSEGPLLIGQADGLSCRSVETFDTFDFSARIMQEAYWVNETVFWSPDPENPAHIYRSGRIQDVEEGLSEFPHLIVNQARVLDFFADFMAKSPSKLHTDFGHEFVSLTVADEGTHPVTATIRKTDGTLVTVRAKYVVGCDGARSQVRESIGRVLEGKFQNHRWGVLDVLADTNFPDIRFKSVIRSDHGSIILIPREGGFLFRIYVDLGEVDPDNREKGRDMPVEDVIAVSQAIFEPYSLDVKHVGWFSIYEVGHRVTNGFDEVPDADRGHRMPHVFTAGDACHTHSAKAGQGMNVSMQDTFNLGWKLAAVLQGRSPESLLHSYHGERHKIAHDLINFDSAWSKKMATPLIDPEHPERGGVTAEEIQEAFIQGGRFTAGMLTQYQPSVLTGGVEHQDLATGYPVGMRFHSAPVIRLADAKPMHLGHVAKADGRWRLYAFADSAPGAPRLTALLNYLATDPASPVLRFTPKGWDLDGVFDIRAIYQGYHRDMTIEQMHPLLRPEVGAFRVRDYEKVFTADHSGVGDIFDMRGIHREQGALIVVRPDQYVSQVLPLDSHEVLSEFFAGFMIDQL